MKRLVIAMFVVVAAVLGVPSFVVAQEPVTSFDQLNTRLKPGDRVWVTDVKGREVEGRIQRLAADELTLDRENRGVFAASDVRMIRQYERDSPLNGILIGLLAGGSPWCLGAVIEEPSHAGVECAEGFIVFGTLGALIGLGIDLNHGGKGAVVYRRRQHPARRRTSPWPR